MITLSVLGVFLGILKWTGIVLLSVLLLVIFLVLLVLLLPFHISCEAAGRNGEELFYRIRFRIRYAYKLLRIEGKLGSDLPMSMSVSFFGRKKKKKAKTEEGTEPGKEEEETGRAERSFGEEIPKKATSGSKPAESLPSESAEETGTGEFFDPPPEKPEKREKKKKVETVLEETGKKEEKEEEEFLRETEEEAPGKFRKILSLIQEESFQTTLRRLKKQLFKLIRVLLPKKADGFLHLGFDDPALMGSISAGFAMFYPLYEDHFRFYPNFEEEEMRGKVSAEFSFRLMQFVIPAIHLLLDRNIRKLIRIIREKDA